MFTMIFLEGGDLGLAILLFLLILFGPPVIFAIIGIIMYGKRKKKAMKIFFIMAGVYLLISLGICGSMGL